MSRREAKVQTRITAELRLRLDHALAKTGVTEPLIVVRCLESFCDYVEREGTITFPLVLQPGGSPLSLASPVSTQMVVEQSSKLTAKAKRAQLRDIQEVSLPVFGTIPAGSPCDNPQLAEGFMPIPEGKKYPKDAFGLKVRGDSMIGKNINDGDIVVVVKNREAHSGDVVVALIDGETTLKTLVQRNRKCKLHSENPERKDPVLTDQSAIQAVMIDKLSSNKQDTFRPKISLTHEERLS